MIHFLTYSNDNMSISRKRCIDSGNKYGADILYESSQKDISYEFYSANKSILDAEFCESGTRPCDGFWLWKPYFVDRLMNDAQDGDYVVYVDAGCEVIADLRHIIDAMDQDVFLFTNGLQHADWCKADVMQAINGKQIEHGHTQVQASMMFFRVNDFTRKFVREWLLWCQMPGMIDDSPSTIPNHPEFANHRYDQAILTCLAIKYGIKTHWWPDAKWFVSQRYRWPDDKYPPMVLHHRMRNNEYV